MVQCRGIRRCTAVFRWLSCCHDTESHPETEQTGNTLSATPAPAHNYCRRCTCFLCAACGSGQALAARTPETLPTQAGDPTVNATMGSKRATTTHHTRAKKTEICKTRPGPETRSLATPQPPLLAEGTAHARLEHRYPRKNLLASWQELQARGR